MQKFFIKTLGCKTNHTESEIIRQNLLEAGFFATSKIEDADFYILNSCTVTSHTDSQANYLLSCAKRKNPKIKTVLCGCMAQVGCNGADIILGNKEKLEIAKHLKKSSVQDIFEEKEFDFHFIKKTNATRPSVKIQDGCNNRCAYCIIPYARGASRSAKIEDIIKQIEILTKNGIKEIVLTGIHIGLWGQERAENLIDLLREIEKTDILRYRLGSLYVNEITDELLNFLKKATNFALIFTCPCRACAIKLLIKWGENIWPKKLWMLLKNCKFHLKPLHF
jgi:threonylcarbamoyladenosine tRNA methylthiotransferase MtaB